MRRVEIDAAVDGVSAGDALATIVRFEQYPRLAGHVKSAAVLQSLPEPTGASEWVLHFRSGLLHWSERERFLTDRGRVEFEQSSGDFDDLHGSWDLTDRPGGCDIRFELEFDFGMPSLESILDPIAERVIAETISSVLRGSFDQVRITRLPSAHVAVSARAE